MGKIEDDFQECLAKGRIKVFGDAQQLVLKQLQIAESDLNEAKEGLLKNRWKWSTIQAYYAMFHTARALLYAKGFREKSHRCLRIAVSHLYTSEGDAFQRMVENFELAKQLRENADYADDFSENGARKLIASAEKWLIETKVLLKKTLYSKPAPL